MNTGKISGDTFVRVNGFLNFEKVVFSILFWGKNSLFNFFRYNLLFLIIKWAEYKFNSSFEFTFDDYFSK